MPSTPYEILNSLEWGDTDAEGDAKAFYEDEDEWADGRSTGSSNARNTVKGVSLEATQILPSDQRQTGNDTTDSQEWTIVTKVAKSKPGPRPKAQPLPKRQPPPTSARKSPPKTMQAPATQKQLLRRQGHIVKKDATVQRLNFPRDNAALAAYRTRKPPAKRYSLHKAVAEIAPDRQLFYKLIEGMGIRSKTFMVPPQNPMEREILIWGEGRDVDRLVQSLRVWEKSIESGPDASRIDSRPSFAKIKSSATQLYQKGLYRLDKEAAFKVYQQVPEPGKYYPFQGWILWDAEESSPNDDFGVSLEAFDPIRRSNKCHIVYEEGIQTLRIVAEKKEHIDEAVKRIQIAIKGLHAQSARNSTKYFVDTTFSSSAVYRDVVLTPSEGPTTDVAGPVLPFSHGKIMDAAERARWSAEFRAMTAYSQHQIESGLKSVIPLLQHQAGQIHIRILFGTFGLTKFPVDEGKASMPLKAFLGRMQTPGVKGELSRDLHTRQSWDAIMDHFKTSDLFEAIDSTTVAEHVQARFVINRVDKPTVRYVRDVSRSITDTYDLEAGKWMRDDGRDSRTPLQLYMTQLDRKTSWKLEVTQRHQLYDAHVDPKMALFAESLVFDCKDIKNVHRTGRKQFSSRSDVQTLKPSVFEQKSSCRYRLAGATDWAVEISRFDRYKPGSDLPISTKWSASMLNTDWDSILSSNERLRIGEHAHWEPKLDTFLRSPESDNGRESVSAMDTLLQTIRDVTNFLDDMRNM